MRRRVVNASGLVSDPGRRKEPDCMGDAVRMSFGRRLARRQAGKRAKRTTKGGKTMRRRQKKKKGRRVQSGGMMEYRGQMG